jgi:hypothetical protein
MKAHRITTVFTLVLSASLFPSYALAQGTLAHVAVGGGWQTTITLLNLAATPANAQITLYSDTGAPLVAPAVGQAPGSQFQMTVPANGSASLVLPDGGAGLVGWAQIQSLNGNALRGQGIFTHAQGGNIWAAAVPLTVSSASSPVCIIPLPTPPPSSQLLPFDNTSGSNAGFAIANVTNTSQAIAIEFDDQNNSVLVTDTINLDPFNHTSFLLGTRYPVLNSHQGILRVKVSSGTAAILGIQIGGDGGIATALPIND